MPNDTPTRAELAMRLDQLANSEQFKAEHCDGLALTYPRRAVAHKDVATQHRKMAASFREAAASLRLADAEIAKLKDQAARVRNEAISEIAYRARALKSQGDG